MGDTKPRSPTIYAGSPNEVMDADFITFEVIAAIRDLKTKSAPGLDGVTNKMLRHLQYDMIGKLTAYFNRCWHDGKIPPAWVLIPKPGKKPSIDALRPISLTSCAGKLMEHIVLNRLNRFMDDRALSPSHDGGFQTTYLSAQDVMLRLKHQIINGEGCSRLDTRAVLGLDLTKAFDNIKHNAVLAALEQIGVGDRTYAYIQDFLTSRTARISIGGATSKEIPIGGRGTPEGWVLFPI